MAGLVPPVVLGDAQAAPVVRPTVEDCVGEAVRKRYGRDEGRFDPQLHHRPEPRLKSFGRSFPAREAKLDALNVRYVLPSMAA